MTRTANIILYGPGLIGQTLIDSLINAIDRYRSPMKIIAVADSSGAIVDEKGFNSQALTQILARKRNRTTFASMERSISADALQHYFSPQTILVDTTDSDSIYRTLLNGISKGSSVTMSNKRNLVLPWSLAEAFFSSPRIRFESTVCAGTPVIATVENLLDSLDEITRMEGCLSGTLNYICSQLDNGTSMIKAIEDAHDLGYTEPDPRDDLNGKDVGRKLLILGRLAGWHLELEDISIEQLYPETLSEVTKEDFFRRLVMLTPKYQQLAHHAASEALSLRYIAEVSPKGGRCYMKAVGRDSEFGMLKGAANKLSIHSRVHNPIPLTLSGAGAGTETTALGLLSDILKLANEIVR